jgi:hypothetical protein
MTTDDDGKAVTISTPTRVTRHGGTFAHLDPEDAAQDGARYGWIKARAAD